MWWDVRIYLWCRLIGRADSKRSLLFKPLTLQSEEVCLIDNGAHFCKCDLQVHTPER